MNTIGRRARMLLVLLAIVAACVAVGSGIVWAVLLSIGIRVGYPAVLLGIVALLVITIGRVRATPARRDSRPPGPVRRPAPRPTFLDVETLRRLERSGHVSHDEVERLAKDLIEGLADPEPEDEFQIPTGGRRGGR